MWSQLLLVIERCTRVLVNITAQIGYVLATINRECFSSFIALINGLFAQNIQVLIVQLKSNLIMFE